MKQPAFWIGLGVMFLVGAFDMTRSISGPLLQRTFELSYAELGILFGSVSIGYLFGSLICGWAVDRIGIQKAILAGVLSTVLGLVLVVAGHWFGAALLGFALSGLGSGWMEVGCNAVIPAVAELNPQVDVRGQTEPKSSATPRETSSQASMFNFLHGLYGVGAFVFPVAGSWLIIALAGWKPLYLLLSAAFTVLLVSTVVTKFPRGMNESFRAADRAASPAANAPAVMDPPVTNFAVVDSVAIDAAVMDSVLGDSAVIHVTGGTPEEGIARASGTDRLPWSWALIGLLIAITTYVMAEAGIGAWLPTYLIHARKFTLAQSSLYLSGFYLTFTVGRLTGHLWVNRIGHRKAVLGSSVLAVILVLLGEWSTSLTFVFIAAGVGFAVIFPTITAIATETFPKHSSRVLGLLFTSGGIGSMAVNGLIGGLASWFGLTISFLLIPISLALTIVGILLAKREPTLARKAIAVRS